MFFYNNTWSWNSFSRYQKRSIIGPYISNKELTHDVNKVQIQNVPWNMHHLFTSVPTIWNFTVHLFLINIVAAFLGMHASPAKHSYAGLPRKCDYRTDRQTPDKVIPMCRYASQATQKILILPEYYLHTYHLSQGNSLGKCLGMINKYGCPKYHNNMEVSSPQLCSKQAHSDMI